MELDVLAQSKAAYGQWRDLWRENANANRIFAPFKSFDELMSIGIGKACLAIANGQSLEDNIEIVRKYQDNVDIICCDKTLGHLLDHGIIPTFCIVEDARVSYEKYMQKWADQLSETTLIMNVCANPKFATGGNWKDVFFHSNRDCIDSHLEFMQISGCRNLLPAATNVSNQTIVFLFGADNDTGRRNYMGYDKVLLLGYDYSWRWNGKYYAFDEDGGGKKYYMRHVNVINRAGNYAYTSSNLLFSAKWLEKYINNFKLPVVQCSKETILHTVFCGDLEKNMQYRFRPTDSVMIRNQLSLREKLIQQVRAIDARLVTVGTDHWYNFLATV